MNKDIDRVAKRIADDIDREIMKMLWGRSRAPKQLFMPFGEGSVYLGDLVADVDGYYKFFPVKGEGYWDQGTLQYIVTKLQEVNTPWDKFVNKEMS